MLVFCLNVWGCSLRRYWLEGEKAGTTDVFAMLPGHPDNVRTNKEGEFWVALHCRRNYYSYIMARYPKLRMFILRLPITARIHYMFQIGMRPHGLVVKYSPEGRLVKVLEDSEGKVVRSVSEVEEKDGKLWLGSVLMNFVAVFDL